MSYEHVNVKDRRELEPPVDGNLSIWERKVED
jgi:hypothetical protein